MAVVLEKINIAGEEVGVYKLTGRQLPAPKGAGL